MHIPECVLAGRAAILSVALLSLLTLSVGCGGSSSPAPAPVLRVAPAPAPSSAPETPAEPRIGATTPQTDALDAGAANVTIEPSDDPPDACVPRNPPLALPVCDRARLNPLLAQFDQNDRDLGGIHRCQPLAVEDLEDVRPKPGHFGDVDAGPGFFGDTDVNGDGKPDMVRYYESVDYWTWLFFVRDKGCLRFVEAVDGYQVELLRTKHHGMRDVRALTYPLQGKLEKRQFDGKTYAP